MDLHEMLLNEEYVKGIYTAIENNPRIPISHGMQHITSVLAYADALATLFNVSDNEKETLFCSVILHDIAQVFLQKNHAFNSSIMARYMLENNESIDIDFIMNQIDIDRVESIIRSHGGKTSSDYLDPLARILILADKLDFTKDRLRPRAAEFSNFDFMNLVDSIDLKLDYNTLVITIFTSNDVTLEELNCNCGLDHFIKVVKFFSEHENVDYKIMVKNNNLHNSI